MNLQRIIKYARCVTSSSLANSRNSIKMLQKSWAAIGHEIADYGGDQTLVSNGGRYKDGSSFTGANEGKWGR